MSGSRRLAVVLLLLAVAGVVGAIFSDLLPGVWWQYVGSSVVVLVAAAVASNEADKT